MLGVENNCIIASELANQRALKVLFTCVILFLRCPSHVDLCGFLFVSENSRISHGDAEPRLTLADDVVKMKFALHW